MSDFSKKTDLLKQNNTDDISLENTKIKDTSINLLNLYASLTLNHPDTTIILSTDGEIISLNNNKLSIMLHFHPKKIEDFKHYLSQEQYINLTKAFQYTLKGKSNRLEITTTFDDKSTLDLLLTFIPITIGSTIVEGVYLVISNITEHNRLRESLQLQKIHLDHAQQIAKIGSWEYSIDENKLFCSDYFYEIFGIEKSNTIPMEKPFEFVHPEDYEQSYQMVQQAIQGQNYSNKFRIYHGISKKLRYIKANAEVLWQNNKPYKLIGVIKDYTAEKHLEESLQNIVQNYKYIFDHLSSGIWMREKIHGNIVFASKSLENILDIPLSTLYADSTIWSKKIHPDDIPNLESCINKLRCGENIQVIYRILKENGHIKWLLEQVVPKLDDQGEITHLFGLVSDITHEMKLEEKLNYLANYDELTELPNQKSLYEMLDHLCKGSEPFSLFYLDIDRFNVINDSLGYHIGDATLKMIAKRLFSLLPEEGYIARLSSNDFIIIMRKFKNKRDIYALANNILKSMEVPFVVEDYELYVSTSIGITFYPEEGVEKLTLLENAHSALFHAKREGKNNFQFSSYTNSIASYKKYVLDRDMRKALVNEEFELYFQPQIEPNQGMVCGAEALIRWHHKEWGLISPAEFIPLAEENHMINAITDWVIKKVCALINERRLKGYHIYPISINVPPIRFMKKGLLELVKEQLAYYNIPIHYLEIEITESSLLKNEKSVLVTLEGLKNLGVKIAIDDFGTGYASLDFLRKFKPNTIKIDQVFIKNMKHDNLFDSGIVSSTIHLGKTLGMKVVAEGVEEFEQLEFLKQKECDMIQGYLYSKPVPLESFEKIMQLGYLSPQKKKRKADSLAENKELYRIEFPSPVPAEMDIIEVNNQQVKVGKTPILIFNIGLGGLRIVSNLKLPVNSNIKFSFKFNLLNETFDIVGVLKWVEEERAEIYSYGVSFVPNQTIKERLAPLIYLISSLRENNEKIPDTQFIYEDPQFYLNKTRI